MAKCKARLVIRGDQQLKTASGNTYAATLAVRSFSTLIAMAARFDLELLQYDAVNAFVIDENVFMRLPPGYRKFGKILILNKALFGLRKSPILWQKLFTKDLQDIGSKPFPHETYCLTYDGITIFFYVDDIVLAFQQDRNAQALGLINQLERRFKLSGDEES